MAALFCLSRPCGCFDLPCSLPPSQCEVRGDPMPIWAVLDRTELTSKVMFARDQTLTLSSVQSRASWRSKPPAQDATDDGTGTLSVSCPSRDETLA